jgi:hyperosmotically inducible protein
MTMRFGVTLLSLLLLSGCTALVVGGTPAGGYSQGKDGRDSEVQAADSAITSSIKGKYAADAAVREFDIGIRTYEGTVTLTGRVATVVARDRAGSIAKSTKDVLNVNNQIVVDH